MDDSFSSNKLCSERSGSKAPVRRLEDRNGFEFGMLRTADKSECPFISREKLSFPSGLERVLSVARNSFQVFNSQEEKYPVLSTHGVLSSSNSSNPELPLLAKECGNEDKGISQGKALAYP